MKSKINRTPENQSTIEIELSKLKNSRLKAIALFGIAVFILTICFYFVLNKTMAFIFILMICLSSVFYFFLRTSKYAHYAVIMTLIVDLSILFSLHVLTGIFFTTATAIIFSLTINGYLSQIECDKKELITKLNQN